MPRTPLLATLLAALTLALAAGDARCQSAAPSEDSNSWIDRLFQLEDQRLSRMDAVKAELRDSFGKLGEQAEQLGAERLAAARQELQERYLDSLARVEEEVATRRRAILDSLAAVDATASETLQDAGDKLGSLASNLGKLELVRKREISELEEAFRRESAPYASPEGERLDPSLEAKRALLESDHRRRRNEIERRFAEQRGRLLGNHGGRGPAGDGARDKSSTGSTRGRGWGVGGTPPGRPFADGEHAGSADDAGSRDRKKSKSHKRDDRRGGGKKDKR